MRQFTSNLKPKQVLLEMTSGFGTTLAQKCVLWSISLHQSHIQRHIRMQNDSIRRILTTPNSQLSSILLVTPCMPCTSSVKVVSTSLFTLVLCYRSFYGGPGGRAM